jgi:hypothetical protein
MRTITSRYGPMATSAAMAFGVVAVCAIASVPQHAFAGEFKAKQVDHFATVAYLGTPAIVNTEPGYGIMRTSWRRSIEDGTGFKIISFTSTTYTKGGPNFDRAVVAYRENTCISCNGILGFGTTAPPIQLNAKATLDLGIAMAGFLVDGAQQLGNTFGNITALLRTDLFVEPRAGYIQTLYFGDGVYFRPSVRSQGIVNTLFDGTRGPPATFGNMISFVDTDAGTINGVLGFGGIHAAFLPVNGAGHRRSDL